MAKLTEQQMCDLAEKFFSYECYGISEDELLIDGHIRVDTILSAAEWIKSLNNNTQ